MHFKTLTALGLALCEGYAHADATLDKIQQRHAISVRVILSGPPFGTLDPKTGEHLGYNVELAKGIGAALGVEIGAGFDCVAQRGTEHRDEMTPEGFLIGG